MNFLSSRKFSGKIKVYAMFCHLSGSNMIRTNKFLVLKKWKSHVITSTTTFQDKVFKRHKSDKGENILQKIQSLKNYQIQIQELQNPTELKSMIVKSTKQSARIKGIREDQKVEELMYQTVLFKSYIEACETSGYLKRAYKIFGQIPNDFCQVGVEAYEAMLKSLARTGDFDRIKDFWAKMVEDKITPTLKCYAAVFQCLGHEYISRDDPDIIEIAQELHSELKSLEYKTNDMLKILPRTQSDYNDLMNGIKIVEPDFNYTAHTMQEANDIYAMNPLVSPLLESSIELESQFPSNVKLEDLYQQYEKQMNMELEGSIIIKSITGICNNKNDFLSREKQEMVVKCEHLLWSKWKQDLAQALEIRIQGHRKRAKNFQFTKHTLFQQSLPIHVFFEMLSVEDYVNVIKDEFECIMFGMSETFSMAKTFYMRELGQKVMQKVQSKHYENEEVLKKYNLVYKDFLKWFLDPQNVLQSREAFALSEAKYPSGPLLEQEQLRWPHDLRTLIGRELFYIVLNNLKISIAKDGSLIIGDYCLTLDKEEVKIRQLNQIQLSEIEKSLNSSPALYVISRERAAQTTEEVKPHPLIDNFYQLIKDYFSKFSASHVPMVVPSLPWNSHSRGGYLICTSEFRRMPHNDLGIKKLDELLDKVNVAYPVFDSLNQLGSTPWKVNQEVLDLVINVFHNQKDFDDVLDDLSVPRHRDMVRKPSANCDNIDELQRKKRRNFSDCTSEELELIAEYQRDVNEVNKLKKEYFSLWCDLRDKLSIANHFRNELIFYPHNIDFRGRVYPIGNHFFTNSNFPNVS